MSIPRSVPEPVLSDAARADLIEIRTFSVEMFDQEIADAYLRGFADTFEFLAEHPFAGTAQPALGKGLRSFTYRKHRIFYSVANDTVLIVRVVHHARNARRALRQ